MSEKLTGQDPERERPSMFLTPEDIEAISPAHPREVISNALIRRSYDRVPFTETLLEKDLTGMSPLQCNAEPGFLYRLLSWLIIYLI